MEVMNTLIGTFVQFLMEKPFTVPLDSAVHATIMNGKSTCSNLKYMSKHNCLYSSLTLSLVNAIPQTLSHQISSTLVNTKTRCADKEEISLYKKLAQNALATSLMFPFTRAQLLAETNPFSVVQAKDVNYIIPKPLYFSVTPLFWNIARNSTFVCTDALVSKYLKGKSNVVRFTTTSLVGTLVSYPFEVAMIRSLHLCQIPSTPSNFFVGVSTELFKNVAVAAVMGVFSDYNVMKKQEKQLSRLQQFLRTWK
ncbi:hypothetical protein EIN_057250 [Entamoeba invadens IP1]|uniref:hypothetical protein n=1 Tax=Entamoeba invadens IP1 TaxID=370355 RepID=UPI0002C3EC19|nr:hypothetical protein EIN_057250 [Entamoeba invadens IP1]ELP93340.1 hypothetical protein EIN_057250 [Entamoeba invadens IP1]|eukprot:XP_004260111.1 hypothetical protein EIN_057250 [Entamoeba invadens IP1]